MSLEFDNIFDAVVENKVEASELKNHSDLMIFIRSTMTESHYQTALERIEKLFEAKPNTPEGQELDKLITLVEAYEEIHYPFDK